MEDDSGDNRRVSRLPYTLSNGRGLENPHTCCTEKKEMFKDFLSFQLADLMDHSMERRHLTEPRALSSLPIRINQSQGI
jgi:hypothetical protein